ncbi:hypothetical protein ARALYDRAFT_894233 [Arabidopsis lyrata subsp. lyrata]|uniref:Uncharacterized protein n=1 Tax=Arabidopsis lyrata subsp. lyrata TaxID=81972 RepID=D7KT39_ARALL|nr:uncharacterized protein LOC9323065 [Arabidopsis lyrata subsp. lyrata]EFH63259.1 hypothetical protein ARALYDRAFT_894233 [Arabidopsis lyrata subsp. lyrata]|eukprot:XP_002887000.1 uncharacterized protein LOC9323065 [Arabidopsis lyrata subsp. lyrata]
MARRRRTFSSSFSSASLLSAFSAYFQDRVSRFDPKISQIRRFGLAGFVFVISLPPSEPDVFPVIPRIAFSELCILPVLSCLTRNHRPFCGPSSTFVKASPPPTPVTKAELISIKVTMLGRPREINLQNLKRDMARSPYEPSNTTPEHAITSLPIWRTSPPPCPMRRRVENGETLIASMVSSLVLGPSNVGPFVFQLRPIMIAFGPSLLPTWPRSITSILLLSQNIKRCVPNNFLQKPRFGPNSFLSLLRQYLRRFMKSIDRRHQLNLNPPLLLCWYKNYLRTLPLESPRIIIHIVKSLKKNGIMIPSLRSGGYRNFFNFSSLSHLLTDSIQELIRNIMVITLESISLKKIGIMISSPRSGDYQSFFIPLYPFLLNFELMPMPIPIPEETFIFQDILPLVPMSSLRFMPANHEAKDTFSTSQEQDLSIVTISKFPDLFAEVSMTHHEIACGLLLDCFCLQFSMAYQTYLSIYVVSFCSLQIIVLLSMLEDLVNFAPMGLIE